MSRRVGLDLETDGAQLVVAEEDGLVTGAAVVVHAMNGRRVRHSA